MNLETPQPPDSELPPPPPPPPAPAAEARPRPRARQVEALLAAVRARQRRQLWLEGGMLGAMALLLLGLGGGFLGLVAPALGRWVLILAPLVGIGVACALGILLSRKMVGDDVRTARLIGERKPELSLDVLAAVELSREAGAAQHSHSLVAAFLGQMDWRAQYVDPATIVDGQRVRRLAQVLGALVLAVAVTLVLSGGRWRAGVAKAWETSAVAQSTAKAEPITGDIELTYRYPAYTGLAPRTVAGTNGEISAPAGTEVLLKTRSDREVEQAEIIVNGEPLPLKVEGRRELSGSFVTKKSGTYRFAFSTEKGEKADVIGPEITLNVEADAPPQATLLSPATELEVDPGQQVVLKYEATDDYGLSELALVFRTPGSQQETRVPLPREDGRRNKGTYTWDLSRFPLKPGDRITYNIEARDNDAVEGPKKGLSRTQVLRIYSAAEHRRAALQKAEALWGRLVDHLADRLEGSDTAKEKTAESVTSGQAVDTSGQQLVADMRALAQELARERDVPRDLVGALLNIADGLGRKLSATADFRRLYLRTQRLRGEDWGTGTRLTAAVNDEIAETEKDVLYLESLLDRQKLEALQEMAKELAEQRRDLASLIEQYKATPSDAARQQILEQITQLRQRINELMQRMAELRKGIRDEHFNAEAMAEMMKDQDVSSGLDEVEKLMREGKADEALAKLQELSMQMDKMMENLNKAQGELGGEQYPELAQKFGDFMKDLDKTLQEQQQVADATKALRDQARSQNRERLSEKGKALKDELMRQVQQVQKDYQELKPEQLNSRAAAPLAEAQSELENLENALKADAYDLASDAAQRTQDMADQLSAMGEHQRKLDEMFGNPEEVREQSAQLAQKLQKDAKTMQEVSQKLQSLFPEPGSQLSPQERQQLQKLSEQQQQLEQRAQGLRQQMEEMQQLAPVFGQESGNQMDEVGQRMGEAAQRMGGQDPGRGYGQQQMALEGLKRFQQQMKESQKGQGQGGLPLPMGMGGRRDGNGMDPREKVELPDEDAFQAPKEFRKDLLDAMKQGAPERYKEQVKRYYEELVK
ncbi:DUF4175 family protein [Hyalangium minutum]|uniref:DUF4175 family protein n=1 Tax=Hyalangium minutum TaxID=394096 RepID=A0A085WMK4_9BACT|nr:DUF4175 family protein [Hyalangium minutum]KFE68917.1 hypothetical protein DB31_6819 [Hyalangium minutum]